jgi:hypothetical protein
LDHKGDRLTPPDGPFRLVNGEPVLIDAGAGNNLEDRPIVHRTGVRDDKADLTAALWQINVS